MPDDHDSRIERIASQIISDNTSPDEQDPSRLQKYRDYARDNFHLDENDAALLVNEAFLYLKLKSSDFDPLQEGDRFGAGFS
ncbi:MAG: hypothetical protein KGI33_10045 [Thaumarchaeota archaeon]|nr:hypothetical protein [Nitrososphaerota archaeon]